MDVGKRIQEIENELEAIQTERKLVEERLCRLEDREEDVSIQLAELKHEISV